MSEAAVWFVVRCNHSKVLSMSTPNIVLNVNGIEVIYNHVILVLKGVSLQVAEGQIAAILGGNGAGKTTTLRAISNLLKGERGEVTKGSIELRGERIENLTPADLVQRGVPVPQAREALTAVGRARPDEVLLGLQAIVAKNAPRGPGMAMEALQRYVRGNGGPGGSGAAPAPTPASPDRKPARPPGQ